MNNIQYFYFVGKCLSMDEHPGFREEMIEMIGNDSIDWTKFVAVCSNHFILPVIYVKFKSNGILEYLPNDVSELLKEIYELNRTRNLRILQQVKEVTAILNKENVYPLYLKGVGHLLSGLYIDLGERMIGDIDFLVPEKDYLRAAELLKKHGYVGDCPPYIDVKSLKHYPRLYKTDVPAEIEIHRLPVSEKYQSWFNAEMCFQEQQTVSTLEGCFVLSDKHSVVLNFIHSQLGHGGSSAGIVAFRDLYDLYQLSKRAEIHPTISDIKPKQKAIDYLVFAGKALGLSERFYPKGNLSAWMFIKKHDLNYRSRVFYYIHRYVNYITLRLVSGYVSQFIQSFYSRRMRQSVFRRISNPQWYKAHLNSYKGFFFPNK